MPDKDVTDQMDFEITENFDWLQLPVCICGYDLNDIVLNSNHHTEPNLSEACPICDRKYYWKITVWEVQE